MLVTRLWCIESQELLRHSTRKQTFDHLRVRRVAAGDDLHRLQMLQLQHGICTGKTLPFRQARQCRRPLHPLCFSVTRAPRRGALRRH
jgi:hypothetical protein